MSWEEKRFEELAVQREQTRNQWQGATDEELNNATASTLRTELYMEHRLRDGQAVNKVVNHLAESAGMRVPSRYNSGGRDDETLIKQEEAMREFFRRLIPRLNERYDLGFVIDPIEATNG